MRKTLITLLVITMLTLSLASCGKKETKLEQDKTKKSEVSKKETKQSQTTKAEDEKTEKSCTSESADVETTTDKYERFTNGSGIEFRDYPYYVPKRKIYVDVPNFQDIFEGYTELFILHDIKYVAVTAEKGDKYKGITDLKKAHEVAFAKFKKNISGYSIVNSLNVETESIVNINGIDMYRYEGTHHCGVEEIYDAYAVGYSFIMDDTPVNICGSVILKDQKEVLIDEMRTFIDAMIQTVRDEE